MSDLVERKPALQSQPQQDSVHADQIAKLLSEVSRLKGELSKRDAEVDQLRTITRPNLSTPADALLMKCVELSLAPLPSTLQAHGIAIWDAFQLGARYERTLYATAAYKSKKGLS